MAITRFAAIDIGSGETEMKIYELGSKNKITRLNHVKKTLELGKGAFTDGVIGFEMIEKLCVILSDFVRIMAEYKTENHAAYATAAIREAANAGIIIDRIKVKTGMSVKILSNSEQRLLYYKALESKENGFGEFIKSGTAIVDIGAGSMQISLFDNDMLVTTQSLNLGSFRISGMLFGISSSGKHFGRLIDELADNDLETFKKLFLKDRQIVNIIAIGSGIGEYIHKLEQFDGDVIAADKFMCLYERISGMTAEQLAMELWISLEKAAVLISCLKIYAKFMESTGSERMWLADIDLCDGMAVEYGLKTKKLSYSHDFDNDIIAAARNISKRYKSNQKHVQMIEENALGIFDAMKKYHGLSKRERLLLDLSAILYDCGRYISISHPAECSYNIIMSTEIIGLSHREREIVANVARCNSIDADSKDIMSGKLDENDYMTVVKLAAILRTANAMDRSNRQKFKDYRIELKNEELIITAKTAEDITLEQSLFASKAAFFAEVYGIRPVLHQKKNV